MTFPFQFPIGSKVDAALFSVLLLPPPAAGAAVLTRRYGTRAGRTSDTGISAHI
jgi:hypothetical protein